jgi:hypothetical protein
MRCLNGASYAGLAGGLRTLLRDNPSSAQARRPLILATSIILLTARHFAGG